MARKKVTNTTFKTAGRAKRDSCQTLIIGGGITGAAVAYSLAKAGHGEILLLERGLPAGGATAKAATLVSQARGNPEVIPYVRETRRQINELTSGEPDSIGFYQVGAIHAAASPKGIEVLDKTCSVSRRCGVFGWEIEPGQVRERLPWIEKKSIGKAYFYSDEAFVDAYLLTTAYLDAARQMGARVMSSCPATELLPLFGGGYEVKTRHGVIHARNVVLAAGAWSNLLLEILGAYIPFAPVRSQYWITGAAP